MERRSVIVGDGSGSQRRRLFLDCEFTTLDDPKLLSMGLVTEDGREFYVELAGESHLKRASTFVLDTVAPQFGLMPFADASRIDMGKRVAAWLISLAEEVQGPLEIHYDFHADMDLLEAALRAAAKWTRLSTRIVTNHIGHLIGEAEVVAAMEQSWKESFATDGIERHHALADARALRAGYLAVHGVR